LIWLLVLHITVTFTFTVWFTRLRVRYARFVYGCYVYVALRFRVALLLRSRWLRFALHTCHCWLVDFTVTRFITTLRLVTFTFTRCLLLLFTFHVVAFRLFSCVVRRFICVVAQLRLRCYIATRCLPCRCTTPFPVGCVPVCCTFTFTVPYVPCVSRLLPFCCYVTFRVSRTYTTRLPRCWFVCRYALLLIWFVRLLRWVCCVTVIVYVVFVTTLLFGCCSFPHVTFPGCARVYVVRIRLRLLLHIFVYAFHVTVTFVTLPRYPLPFDSVAVHHVCYTFVRCDYVCVVGSVSLRFYVFRVLLPFTFTFVTLVVRFAFVTLLLLIAFTRYVAGLFTFWFVLPLRFPYVDYSVPHVRCYVYVALVTRCTLRFIRFVTFCYVFVLRLRCFARVVAFVTFCATFGYGSFVLRTLIAFAVAHSVYGLRCPTVCVRLRFCVPVHVCLFVAFYCTFYCCLLRLRLGSFVDSRIYTRCAFTFRFGWLLRWFCRYGCFTHLRWLLRLLPVYVPYGLILLRTFGWFAVALLRLPTGCALLLFGFAYVGLRVVTRLRLRCLRSLYTLLVVGLLVWLVVVTVVTRCTFYRWLTLVYRSLVYVYRYAFYVRYVVAFTFTFRFIRYVRLVAVLRCPLVVALPTFTGWLPCR